jgi:amino acid permease
MKKIINNLRNRSEEERRHILNIVSLICGIILFIIWIYSLGATIFNNQTQQEIKKDFEPFKMLKDSILDDSYNKN